MIRANATRGAPLRRLTADLARDRRGLALLEFALALPLVVTIGFYGIETANLALANLRVSQIALNLADNASRVGLQSDLPSVQLREVDINDILQAAKIQGAKFNLTTNGRITLSSLEKTGGTQRIHWQRCIGLKSGTGWDSSYGTTKPTDGIGTSSTSLGTTTGGMGEPGAKVVAPDESGVIFVEVNYLYKPVVGSWVLRPRTLHYTASFIVRDNRDFTQVYNPGDAPRATCDLHAS